MASSQSTGGSTSGYVVSDRTQIRNWFCAQMGAREHYAIPRALFAAGVLGGLMTDFWAGKVTRGLGRLSSNKSVRSLAARRHQELPSRLVKSWNLRAFVWEARLRRMAHRGGVTGRYLGYCEVGRRFAGAVAGLLEGRNRMPEDSVYFGYDTCSLEVMEHLKRRGIPCIVDQIDPCRVEIETVRAEQLAWPGWEEEPLEVPEEFYERHREEWSIADRVMVNSDFTRQALVEQGVPGDKIAIVPLSLETSDSKTDSHGLRNTHPQFSRAAPLRILFLGQVMLRKGIQYLVQAAEFLRDSPVIFDVVGPIQISKSAVASAPANVIFHGRVTRDETDDWYRNADVFVLPTLSDGFAITQLEAMANGLPVIATPNCGAVVTDGVDGFVVPPRDSKALSRAICRYLEEPACLANQHRAALVKSKQFSLPRIGSALLRLGQELRGRQSGTHSDA